MCSSQRYFILRWSLIFGLLFVLAACATSPQANLQTDSDDYSIFGFWSHLDGSKEAQEAIDSTFKKELGSVLKDRDLQTAVEAQSSALNNMEGKERINWSNSRSGRGGTVSVGPLYMVNNTQCRDYEHTIRLELQQKVVSGAACLKDGRWQLIN
ncbi:RT0821/Lpp0805 family surface protein [Polycladidibacter stylochi]|uniref:RT0821/Lpp0805 family surface protein n=1 Tax=Polycladidibacter stylochi TaxID=1807766 RepID=UPI0008313AF7|nr:RT0821/Lpp0805 family surface protein [Pseudovibrio stylochi]